jgi:hypothetical protein
VDLCQRGELPTAGGGLVGGLDDEDPRLRFLDQDGQAQLADLVGGALDVVGAEELHGVGVGQQPRARQRRRRLAADRGRHRLGEPLLVREVTHPAHEGKLRNTSERLLVAADDVNEVAVWLPRLAAGAAHAVEPLVLDGPDELHEVVVAPGREGTSPLVGRM